MKNMQLIILLTITLLSSCSFLRLKEAVIDQSLKQMFEEHLKDQNKDEFKDFFVKLMLYAIKSNQMLHEKLKQFIKEGEENLK